ncbi:hypothetical protein ACS0TY_005579 [Phlomoides rotata]
MQSHIRVLESSQENISLLLMGLEYLINISYVDDTEVFKVCLDYWNSLVSELLKLTTIWIIPYRKCKHDGATDADASWYG